MSQPQPQWQVPPSPQIPQWFIDAVAPYAPTDGRYAAQLLWQRGMREPALLPGFLDANRYQPESPFEFGQEMKWAVQRLLQARQQKEKVTIWGDFDADGITSTSVLWDGLGQFFAPDLQLDYYIPNRHTESHGLNHPGIERLAAQGTKLIVTCDTGSTNLSEIALARQLGVDIIITDHHTLPDERPDVVSIINPRYFGDTHPLYHLSGVAVAYKLVEALYIALPQPERPLEDLLDLVAIGLIADLVQLSGDCRYLAQRGIQQLQKQSSPPTATRPGVARLLELCKRNGDRPTDISFGLGPRINAVSRIQGDARFCVELLTSRDPKRCEQLAQETELANARRKSLQKDVTAQVKKKLAQLDLSTTNVIVLEDPQWQGGVLGLVAGQIAQEYGRPTILLSTAEEQKPTAERFARGSARSVNGIDLYELVKSQAHLLHRFGGHPFAAGLSLPMENLPLFREGINQQLRQQSPHVATVPLVEADLVVTVSELGKELFRELKLLEPYGMGNPIPKLLIQNCWFTDVWNENIKDRQGKKVQYIKTTFELCDRSTDRGFAGVWWGHYKDELPQEPCDAVVELDSNDYKRRYEVRLVAVKPKTENFQSSLTENSLFDWRQETDRCEQISSCRVVDSCPTSWDDLHIEYRRALAQNQALALAYSLPAESSPEEVWKQLVGIAKYLSRTENSATRQQIQKKLNVSDRTLTLGFQALAQLGFECCGPNDSIQISWSSQVSESELVSAFLAAVEEEQFKRRYFSEIPVTTLQEILAQSSAR
ncbi:MAG: single-stranded-DNA-specific exonuclease RecJ [Cyanophyceae cyanobacterium]